MADHVLSTLANFVSGKLSSLISDGTMPILNLLGELGRLQDTFSKIDAELFVALEKTELSRSEEDLVRKLKNVLYEADDILDSLAMEDQWPESVACNELPKYVCVFFSRMKHIFEIMKIRGSLDSIEKLSRIHIVPEEGRSRVPDVLINREAFSVEHEEHVIGREKDAAAIAELLLDSDNASNVSTTAIIGMGGLGKTTLARSVFNNPEVEAQFDKKIWVCVSDENSIKIIVQKIIRSAGGNPQGNDMEPLGQHLQQLIGRKRYLLVLDDVWSENRESWDMLKAMLSRGEKGSKILITTRSQGVADALGANCRRDLKGLSEGDAWDLFEKKAFRQRQEGTKDPELVAIGKQVMQRCAGVPLAIKAMGALLSTKTNVQWQQFKDKELSRITQATEGDIFPILKLSYYDLEPSLKQCFAYCSLFPKDYYIERETLIRLWIAQGFIQASDRNQDLEDIGNHYFTQLLWKSFFQEPGEDSLGNIEVVKMHDLMHDLATLVAKFECAYLNSSKANQTLKDTRHVSLHDASILCGLQPGLFEPNKIRTILLLNKIRGDDNCEEAFLNKLSSFGHLRVLDLHGLKLKTVPKFIGEMKHLRYLDLSENNILRLPNFITELRNLQTLNLSNNGELRGLPHDLKNLKNLRQLVLDGCDGLTYMPRGIGELTCLRTLTKFVVGSAEMSDSSTHMSCGIGGLSQERDTSKCRADITELTSLNNLRGALKIKNSRNFRSVIKPDILKDKKGLEILKINFGEWSDDDIGLLEAGDNSSGLVEETWGDSGLLEGALQLPNLKKLKFRNYNDEETVRNLTFMLPNLIKLAIYKSKCKYFPDINLLTNLKTIDLNGLTHLTFLPSITHHLKSLKSICFIDLPALQFLPPLHKLSSLESLKLEKLKSVKYIQDWDSNLNSPAKASSPLFFPSLKKLELVNMPNLKGWWKQSSSSSSSLVTHRHPPSHDDDDVLPPPPPHFPILSFLSIIYCRNLMSVPLFPYVKILEIKFSRKEILKQQEEYYMMNNWIINGKNNGAISSSSSVSASLSSISPFSKVVALTVDPGVEVVPEGLLQHFTSLRKIQITSTDYSQSFTTPPILRGTVEGLEINGNVKFLPDWITEFTSLQLLRFLQFKETVLPKGLDLLTSVKQLWLYDCDELSALPETMTAWASSLQQLDIEFCPKLESLPHWLSQLTSLQELWIDSCPKVEERCSRVNEGADWPNIAHIPFIKINNETIQDARYMQIGSVALGLERQKVRVLGYNGKNSPAMQRKMKVLSRLVPGCRKEPIPVVLLEAVDYIADLNMHLRAMSALAELLSGGSSSGAAAAPPT